MLNVYFQFCLRTEWQELSKVYSGSSVSVICPAALQTTTNSMPLDLAVNAAVPVIHYEEKSISLFLFPFTSLSCMFAIVNWQTCQWLICLGVRPAHHVLALVSPYLASVSSLSLIRREEGRKVAKCSKGNIKNENKIELWEKMEAEIETEIGHD